MCASHPTSLLHPRAGKVGKGQEEPFVARRLSGREGWVPVLRWSAGERRGCADSGPSYAGGLSGQIDPDPTFTFLASGSSDRQRSGHSLRISEHASICERQQYSVRRPSRSSYHPISRQSSAAASSASPTAAGKRSMPCSSTGSISSRRSKTERTWRANGPR